MEKYTKLDHREHILSRPGMYIGSVEVDDVEMFVYKDDSMIKKKVKYIPGLYKIYDEILVNAIDHSTRLIVENNANLLKNIKIDINKETGEISVYNDGEGIDVEKHSKHDIYIPELIFGHLLTSSNYNDNESRIIGGQNGIGAKACNIFSKTFIVETVDSKKGLKYKQVFENNMEITNKPIIKPSKVKSYTKITFLPDYNRFSTKGLSEDMYALFERRAYDIAAITGAKVSVYLNGNKIGIQNFEKYVKLFTEEFVYEKINDRCEIACAISDTNTFQQISFVNGISTVKGGKHVDHITNQITSKIMKKLKDDNIKNYNIKNYLFVFVKAIVADPTFDSQSKETLTSSSEKFNNFGEVSKKFIDKLWKSKDLTDKLDSLNKKIVLKADKKTDGKKSNKIYGLPKLEDANFAGTQKSKSCTLILTEGDSAKTMALAGISEVGRNFYGVFPLRGKLLNVKDIPTKKLIENEEIQNIKKILGLESGKEYADTGKLRYGKIMIMTDQDYDGSHIRGLIINMFHTLWHSLLDKDFIVSLLTPIIKVTKDNNHHSFYNVSDYDKWTKENKTTGWKVKYYKGLGTSNDKEAKEYFKNMNLVSYKIDENTDNTLELAFNKKMADQRKKWLEKYNENQVNINKTVSYTDFINKELIHFSIYDVKRSIPHIMDGFKPSQRKILYCCFKRNLVNEIKVAQLAGYISEHAGYHHGEVSLQAAIVNMAQDFVGSNNINLLKPNGMFGSRRMGGKDASEARYIYTQLDNLVPYIFKKEDSGLLDYLSDDGFQIEPVFYLPIIPMILVNGACGIGTGYSTNILMYNPTDIINSLKGVIENKGIQDSKQELIPWYKGYKGTISSIGNGTYSSTGVYNIENDNVIHITELPIGVWTSDYKEFLDNYVQNNPTILKDYESQYTNDKIHFILHLQNNVIKTIDIEKEFKLSNKNLSIKNMHLFDSNNVIKKYNSVDEIIYDFYVKRLEYYNERKTKYLLEMRHLLSSLNEKVRFINCIIMGQIQLMNSSKKDLEKKLDTMSFTKVDGSFNYLLNLPLYNLTKDKINELTNESAQLNTKILEYTNTTVETIWLKELDELLNKLK